MRDPSRPGLFASAPRGEGRRAAGAPVRHGRRTIVVLTAALGVVTVWALATTYCLVFHDEMLTRFVARQRTLQYAYEARVGALQLQIDRSATEQRLNRDGIEERVAALIERQVLIERRQGLLSGLSAAGPLPGLPALPAPAPAARTRPVPVFEARPEAPPPEPSMDVPGLRADGGGRADVPDRRIEPRLGALDARLEAVAEQQSLTLARIARTTDREAERLRIAVLQVGLEPSRFGRAERGMGGPLVPVSADAFDLAWAEAQRSASEAERLRRVVGALPLRRPLGPDAAFTSGFGTRLDPFTRGLALHTGVDLRAEYGAPARATAAGRVTATEYAGGYGNMVEIDHGHGIVTRYAHLAGYTVVPGQRVEAGEIVGRVGSTGRSTGTHLHYETRIDGEPVDPQRFLRAGAGLDLTLVAAR